MGVATLGQAFIYFLQTGQPWDGGSPPQVYDPLYLSLAAEIEAADQRPLTETLIEPTWTMRLPTTLTMLRTNTPTLLPRRNRYVYYRFRRHIEWRRVHGKSDALPAGRDLFVWGGH